MKDPLPLRWICCCCPCGPKKSDNDASELERGTPEDIELPPTTTKLEDGNAYIAEVAINMALRRSTETARRTSLETAVPVREIDPPPTYDSVWTEQTKERRAERDAGHVAHSGPVAVTRRAEPEVPVASHGSVVQNEPPTRMAAPTTSASQPNYRQHDVDEEDSDFESRISTPRTLTPPTTVPPTLADADEDEERRRWLRDEKGGARRA